MITRLRAGNFKSWKDTGDLRLGRLTGLFGTNSSGKTSILQVLPHSNRPQNSQITIEYFT
jgi:AAA15 family ATPase/GTPase